MKKQKLTIDEQITHISKKGIRFNINDEKYARKYLLDNTYYFKIKSYGELPGIEIPSFVILGNKL